MAVRVTVGLLQVMGPLFSMVKEGGVVFSATVIDLLVVQPLSGLVAVNVYRPPCVTVAEDVVVL